MSAKFKHAQQNRRNTFHHSLVTEGEHLHSTGDAGNEAVAWLSLPQERARASVEVTKQKCEQHLTLETQMPASHPSQRPNSYGSVSKSKLLFVLSLLFSTRLLPKEMEGSTVICQSGFCLLLSLQLLGSRQTPTEYRGSAPSLAQFLRHWKATSVANYRLCHGSILF